MFCSKCGNQIGMGVNFCRTCGTELGAPLTPPASRASFGKRSIDQRLSGAKSKDPDELTAGGIANVIIGDGFFMVAVLLSATHSSSSSLLWLFLLIPAFFFFGKGFADVLHARQIRRRVKQNELNDGSKSSELPGPRVSFIDTIRKHTSGELIAAPSVTEGTTRDLT
jgi:hypothetical protein